MTTWEAFLGKCVNVERNISAKKGPFALFALVLRNEDVEVASTSSAPIATNRWEVVVSAPWLSHQRKADYEFVANELLKGLQNNIVDISGFYILSPTSEMVRTLNALVKVQHKWVEIHADMDVALRQFNIKTAFVITSNKAAAKESSKRGTKVS